MHVTLRIGAVTIRHESPVDGYVTCLASIARHVQSSHLNTACDVTVSHQKRDSASA